MKKFVLILLLLLVFVVFAGCSNINVTCGVDENNNAFIKYEVKVLTDKVEANNAIYANEALDTLEEHFNNLGFATKRQDFYLLAEITKPSANYDLAVDNLKELLTNEKISVFYDVSVQKINADIEQGYYVSLNSDYSKWILDKGVSNLPADIKSQIEQYASGEVGTLTLMLPANQAESTNGKVGITGNIAKASIPIVLNKKINIDLSTKVSGNGSVINNFSPTDMITYKTILAIFLCIGTAVLLAIMIIMLRKHFKSKNNR